MNARFFFYFVFLVLLTMSASTGLSQPKPKPNFSGNWLLDQEKSTDSGITTWPDLPMKIDHQDPVFRVTRSYDVSGQIVEGTFLYYTDGRGEMNDAAPTRLKNQGGKSKTKWSGNKVVIRWPMDRLEVRGDWFELELVTEYKLSEDGNVLTQTTRMVNTKASVPTKKATQEDKKRVYNRV